MSDRAPENPQSLEQNGDAETRGGFIAVVGAPNVGKSTLVNQLVGAKVSIVSPKVQTTRSRVLGIFIDGAAQVALIDTPGIFEPRRRLDRAMVSVAWTGADEADGVVFMIDAARGLDDNTRRVMEGLKNRRAPLILAINKVDSVAKPVLLDLAAALNEACQAEATFMISALKGDGVADLASHLAALVPPGPWLFPEDEISDLPARLLAAEITREKLYLQLHQELPYHATVETESWEQKQDGSAVIRQVIYVARSSQKGIVLGKSGSRIKSIGQAAREELEELLDHKIHLLLHVKVAEKWLDDPERYRDWGLDFNS